MLVPVKKSSTVAILRRQRERLLEGTNRRREKVFASFRLHPMPRQFQHCLWFIGIRARERTQLQIVRTRLQVVGLAGDRIEARRGRVLGFEGWESGVVRPR